MSQICRRWAELREFPIIPCNLCGSQDGLQRQVVKEMLNAWERQYPGRIDTIFNAIKNVSPSQLADTNLFNFLNLQLDRSDQEVVEEDFTNRIRSLNL